jgi:hypothetical protein
MTRSRLLRSELLVDTSTSPVTLCRRHPVLVVQVNHIDAEAGAANRQRPVPAGIFLIIPAGAPTPIQLHRR